MIKFFKSVYNYNWVSDKGQFVGFSKEQQCCEAFGYCYVNKIFDDIEKIFEEGNKNSKLKQLIESDIEDKYNNFVFKELVYKEIKNSDDYLDTNVENYVFISIFDNLKEDIVGYLVLYNCHNGYYWHGLDYRLDTETTYCGL